MIRPYLSFYHSQMKHYICLNSSSCRFISFWFLGLLFKIGFHSYCVLSVKVFQDELEEREGIHKPRWRNFEHLWPLSPLLDRNGFLANPLENHVEFWRIPSPFAVHVVYGWPQWRIWYYFAKGWMIWSLSILQHTQEEYCSPTLCNNVPRYYNQFRREEGQAIYSL